jgi:Tfp pilus assembly protein PilN
MSLINLLPQDYFQRRQGRRTNVLCVILFAVVMCGIVSASMVSRSKAKETQSVMDNLNRSYSQAAQTISQMQTLKSQKETILDKRRRIEGLQDPVPKSLVLAILTNARPDGVSLIHVKLDSKFPLPKKASKTLTVKTTKPKDPAAPPPRPTKIEPKVTVEIIGLARTDFQVARYLANLTDSGLTQSVDLSYTQNYKPGSGSNGKDAPAYLQGLREFKLRCLLNKKIDAKAMSKRWRFSELRSPSIDMTSADNKDDADDLVRNVPGTR